MESKKIYYYRIFDDNEELDFLKTTLEYEKIRDLMKEFEKKNSEYLNKDFVNFLRSQDPDADIIEVTNIYY
jgi:hypothetical protein